MTYPVAGSWTLQLTKSRHAVAVRTESASLENAEQIRAKFKELLGRTNKENPRPADITALSDLLGGNKSLELWRDVASAGQLAELTVIENANVVPALKEAWKQRLQVLKKRSRKRRRSDTRAASDSTCRIVLVEIKSHGVELFAHDETIDHAYSRHVLVETLECCTETLHSSM